jgi:uncharacterized protein YbjT (DUF2867 family)
MRRPVQMMETGKTAIIAGATGLIGAEVLRLTLETTEYKRVIALVRKPIQLTHAKLEQRVVDYDHLKSELKDIQADDVYCCLGTTIKKAKSQEAFRRVDYDYPVALAEWALESGASAYMLVSSMGADAASSIFYSRVKGQLEQALQSMPLSSLHIFRPSLLLGNREEFRFGEKAAAVISGALPFLFMGPLRKYKPVPAVKVAEAMVSAAGNNQKGCFIYESDQLQ